MDLKTTPVEMHGRTFNLLFINQIKTQTSLVDFSYQILFNIENQCLQCMQYLF